MLTRPHNILILGASSLITPWLVGRLTQNGLSGQCYSRTQTRFDPGDNFTWQALDACCPTDFHPQSRAIVISLLPLWLLPPLLPQLQYCRQLIAFSTTSIFSKHNSPASSERRLIRQILEAEEQITNHCNRQQIPWTLLRPTMIYDGLSDTNVTAIADFIKKWQVLPVAQPANGLRQPVHADDLAGAAVAAINNPASFKRAFNLGGGETLSYREMVTRIFTAAEKDPRIIGFPVGLFKAICSFSTQGSGVQNKAAMFIRMNQDLTCDWSEARDSLGYAPRPFLPRHP